MEMKTEGGKKIIVYLMKPARLEKTISYDTSYDILL